MPASTIDQSAVPDDDERPVSAGRRPPLMMSSMTTRISAADTRLRDRVDEEQERVGPVRLHLPAEAGGRAEARATVGAPLALRRARDRSRPTPGEPSPPGGADGPVAAGVAEAVTASAPRAGLRGGPSAPASGASSARRGGRPRSSRRGSAPRPPAAASRPGTSTRRRRAGASRRDRPRAGSWRGPAPRGSRGAATGKLSPHTK